VHTVLTVLRSLSIASSGVLVGGMLIELVVVIPLLRDLGPIDAPRALRICTPRALRTQPAISISAIWAGIGIVVAAHWTDVATWRVALTVAGVLLLMGGAAVTLGLYLPKDKGLRALDATNPDVAEFGRLLQGMNRWNNTRLALNLAGFVCFIEAALL
jgi:uncharacterized membrane protein